MPKSPTTDYDRWSTDAHLSGKWAERADFAARFVPPGLAVMDVGCGAMQFEHSAKARLYIPVDVVARDERTRVIDLNAVPLPEPWIDEVELVSFLGVLEYLVDPQAVLAAIARRGVAVLCTYKSLELAPNANRRASGWVNDYSSSEFRAMAEAAGFTVSRRVLYKANQHVYLLLPEHEVEAKQWWRESAGKKAAKRAAKREARKLGLVEQRPVIMVAGFYGRGNSGDEALFHAVYEAFCDDYDIYVAVDEHGAFRGFWDWYPYTRCRVVHQTDLHAFSAKRTIAAFMIGGGGLALGYAGNFVISARLRRIPTFVAGVDLPELVQYSGDPDEPTKPMAAHVARRLDVDYIRSYLTAFQHIMVRTERSLRVADEIGVPAMLGGDWALRLLADNSPDDPANPKRAVIVVREFALEIIPYTYVQKIERLIAGLRDQGWEPVLLPFCPEDVRNAGQLGLDKLAPSWEHWWNPRRMKQIIAESGLVISVGRLHALIFAAPSATVPVVSLVPPLKLPSGKKSISKIDSLCADWEIEQFFEVEDLLAAAAEGRLRPANPDKVGAATRRLDESIAIMKDIMQRNLVEKGLLAEAPAEIPAEPDTAPPDGA